MANVVELDASRLRQAAPTLRAGQRVLLSGAVYTARDAAHKRIARALQAGEPLPFPLGDAVIYYAGPTQAPPGLPIGSCGPTTSARMDLYTPALLRAGLAGMVGKGGRSKEVCDAVRACGAVYLCALGGAGALACACIRSCDVIAYEDLGCESVKRLIFERFPLVVAVDCRGGNLFEQGQAQWKKP